MEIFILKFLSVRDSCLQVRDIKALEFCNEFLKLSGNKME